VQLIKLVSEALQRLVGGELVQYVLELPFYGLEGVALKIEVLFSLHIK
jgi:hypothetical protein